MNIENDYLSNKHDDYNLSRSKSCDDLPTILDNENDEPIFNLRKSFFRQGAFRKREHDAEMLKRKRTSLIEGKNGLHVTLPISKDCEYILEKESPKKVKYSFSSIAIVKEMWKSLKKENKVLEKEEIKKRNGERNNSLTQVYGCPKEVCEYPISSGISHTSSQNESPNINIFLHKYGEKFSQTMDRTVFLSESSWEELVDDPKKLTKLETDRQAAIWEIIETESTFMKQLSVITHVFYPVLEQLLTNYRTELSGITIQDVFGNINDLCCNHWTMWHNYISLPLSMTKVRKVPLDIMLMKDGFCRISQILSSYISFMHSLPGMREKIRKMRNESPIFNQYVEWTKAYCRMCRDGHECTLSLPFQRITRYKILLERVRSLCCEEQKEDITDMINSVHNFLQRMNSSIVGKYSMKDIKEKIVGDNMKMEHLYDMARILNEDDFRFDITRPSMCFSERLLIHEGRLKLRKCYNKSLEVQCYLCSDLLLVCKPLKSNWDKMKVHKSPIRLDKLLVKEKSESSFMVIVYNDFKVVDNVMVMVGDGDEVKLWVDKCSKARTAFLNQFTKSNGISPINYSFDTGTTIQDYSCPNEYKRIWKYSETTSSTDSTYSTDSAISCATSTSTQIDYCQSMSNLTLGKQYQNGIMESSVEDLSTITEIYPDSPPIPDEILI